MGRIFQTRKATMFKRYAKMAKAFTKIGREIVMAVKAGGPHPENNPRLRMIMQNAKAVNMPKVNVDAAIKRASEKDSGNYDEIIYEGYAPHGVPVLISCTTNNPTRTVASVRLYFNRANGAMGTNGSVAFMFEHVVLFKIDAAGLNKDDMELELIDFGLEEIGEDSEGNIIIRTAFNEFGNMAKALDDKKIEVITAELTRIPTTTMELDEDAANDVLKLVDKLEQDEDVQKVYHNLK